MAVSVSPSWQNSPVMSDASRRQSGFLVLADISGYTAFLTGSELEHAQGIIEDLTRAILNSFTPAVTLVKLEGDAVFGHSPDGRLCGERVLDLVERTYWDFADCREDMQRNTTCTCHACANIAALDLKFVIHHGEYVTHSMGGREDLAGPDVILVHRLLKNDVREATGCGAYALLTDAALATMPGVAVLDHTTRAEDFGEIRGGVLNLQTSLERMRASRRVFVEPKDCDFQYVTHVPLSCAEAWEWWTNPALSPRFQREVKGMWLDRNDSGRQGVDGVMHCAHGGFDTVARYLDWRPFEYYTAERVPSKNALTAPPPLVETVEFLAAEGGGTNIVFRCRGAGSGLGARVKLRLMKPFVRKTFIRMEEDLNALLDQRATEDAAESGAS
jgi:hypothetical protein